MGWIVRPPPSFESQVPRRKKYVEKNPFMEATFSPIIYTIAYCMAVSAGTDPTSLIH